MNREKNWEDELLIVLVLYQVRLQDSIAFQSLSRVTKESTTFYVYDNSPHPQSTEGHSVKIIYRHNPDNVGVSRAYNDASLKANELGKKWMLLTDQDTFFPATHLNTCKEMISDHPNSELFVPLIKDEIGFVSPFRIRWGRGMRLTQITAGEYDLSDLCFINSGLLISLHLFNKAGGYDERFPLDFSDLAFIQKLKHFQARFNVIPSNCKHQLSAIVPAQPEERLKRFKVYCQSAILFGELTKSTLVHKAIILARAFKLSLKQKKIFFLKTAWKYLFWNR